MDVPKLDSAWQRTDQYIVKGGQNGQDNRYEKAGLWFSKNCHSYMLFAVICDDGIEFTDGRHRFSWLRDQGVRAIQLQVPGGQASEFGERFCITLRATALYA